MFLFTVRRTEINPITGEPVSQNGTPNGGSANGTPNGTQNGGNGYSKFIAACINVHALYRNHNHCFNCPLFNISKPNFIVIVKRELKNIFF